MDDPETLEPDEQLVTTVTLDNNVEAALFDALLTDEEIPHVMQTFHDAAYDGIFQMQRGWGRVSAPERYKTRIQDLLHELRASKPVQEGAEASQDPDAEPPAGR